MSEIVRALLSSEEVGAALCGHVVRTKRPDYHGTFTGNILLIFDGKTILPGARVEVLLKDEEAA